MFTPKVAIYFLQISVIKKLSRKDSLWIFSNRMFVKNLSINVAIYTVLIFSTPSFAEMKGIKRIF